MNREGIAVQKMNPVPPGGAVFYASLPRATEACKELLIAALWDHLEALGNPLWKRCRSSPRSAFPIQLVSGLLGRPQLLLGEFPGPAISFCAGGGNVWAAICGDESDIGIDLAGADEFCGEYPLNRVFHPEELDHAVKLADGSVAEAAALLWSVKEAVVKALGCGFHLVDPRQITVYQSATVEGGYVFPVGLSGNALARFPLFSGPALWVHSLPRKEQWLSIALLSRRPAVYG